MDLMMCDESHLSGTERSTTSPSSIEHIFLCSWPETHESMDKPFRNNNIL